MNFKEFKSKYQKAPVEHYPNSVQNTPAVSVCVMTYQHKEYIKECLDSILMQKTDFPFEILLGEDASTDGTREICIEYAQKYPDRIRLFLHCRENNISINGSPTGQFNFLYNLYSAKGKYIALCEGDDYWTDANKLQLQIDYLEKTPKASGCFHDVINVDENSIVIKNNYYKAKQQIYSQHDCLTKLVSSYATCSLVCRSTVFIEPWPIWFQKRACDEFLDLLITQNRKELHYLPNRRMGAYRIHSGGIWQGNSTVWRKKEVLLRKNFLKLDNKFYKRYKVFLDSSIEHSYRSLFLDSGVPFIKRINYGFKYLMVGEKSFRKIIHIIRGLAGRIKRQLISANLF